MNSSALNKYLYTLILTPVTPYNSSVEELELEDHKDEYRRTNERQIFFYVFAFIILVFFIVTSMKLYKRMSSTCVPLSFPGGMRLVDEEVEEVVVFSNNLEELIAPNYQESNVDSENNGISKDNPSFKKDE